MNSIDISLFGEYYVSAMMHLWGWNAAMTLKNYPGIDIFGYNPQSGRHTSIQIKTGNNKYTVLTGIKLGNFTSKIGFISQPYVFVHIKSFNDIECFILKASDFVALAQQECSKMNAKNNGANSLIKFKWKDLAPYKDQWQNLW